MSLSLAGMYTPRHSVLSGQWQCAFTVLKEAKVSVNKAIAYITEVGPKVPVYCFIKLSPIVRGQTVMLLGTATPFLSAKARRGRQRRAGRPRSLHGLHGFLFLLFLKKFSPRDSGHEPCCASRDWSPSGYCLLFLLFSFFLVVWVSPCSFHPVPCRRCWLVAYSSARRFSCFVHFLFHHFVSPEADEKLLLTCSSTWTA